MIYKISTRRKRFMLCIILIAGISCLPSCSVSRQTNYRIAYVEGERIEINSSYDSMPDSAALAILTPYQDELNQLMSPIIGESAEEMTADYPESKLGNLIAEVIRLSAQEMSGIPIDLGIINIYGIRASLSKGNICIGDVYRILPFENTLCVVTLSGKELKDLLTDIIQAKNMNISGACIETSRQGVLLNARIKGKQIDDERLYQIATIDYLAEGNDGLKTFAIAKQKRNFEQSRLRDCFIAYIRQMQSRKKSLTSAIDRRIIIR